MRRIAFLLLIVAVSWANCLALHATEPTGIPWAGTVRDGLKQALINQKQILLYFYAPELPACAKCEEQVLANAEVQQAVTANYIPVKVNVREVPATARFYQANDDAQLPRVLILSADDKVVNRFTASAIPAEFVAQLKAGVNPTPANPKLEQIGSLAKTASSFLAPTAEPTAVANANLAANTTQSSPSSSVTPTAWQPGTTGIGANALLLPNFAPGQSPVAAAAPAPNTPAASPGSTKASSLLPAAVGPLARTSNEGVAFGASSPATTTSTTSNLASYGLQGVAAPTTTAATPTGYGMQNVVPNLAAAAQPYQQQAQQTMTQWQNQANQTLANAQTQVNQGIASAQQNVQNQVGAAANQLNAAAPAIGSFYDPSISSRPSETKNAGLATIPGMGGPATTSAAMPAPQVQLAASPYSLNGMATATIPTYPAAPAPTSPAQPSYAAATPAAKAPTPPATPAPTNYAQAPGASYGIPNNAPPSPALPGHPKEKAGLANYSNDNLQGYVSNGGKPVLPSAQVATSNPIQNASLASQPKAPNSAPPVGNMIQTVATSASPEICLQGNCPVTITESKKWAKGNPQYGAVHRGKTYLFASAAEQQKFLAAPDKYSPVLGGNDPVVMFHEGRYIAGTPVYGAMYKSRMYLFSTPAAKAEFEANPTKYEQAVSVAETQAGIIVR
jgi:YHS domain-containing protein/thioredoxin-related protein